MSLFIKKNIMEEDDWGKVRNHTQYYYSSAPHDPNDGIDDYFYGMDDYSTGLIRIGAVITLLFGVVLPFASLGLAAVKMKEGADMTCVDAVLYNFLEACIWILAKAVNGTMDKYTCEPNVEGSGVFSSKLSTD